MSWWKRLLKLVWDSGLPQKVVAKKLGLEAKTGTDSLQKKDKE